MRTTKSLTAIALLFLVCFLALWLQSDEKEKEPAVNPVLDLTRDADLWKAKQADGAEIRFLLGTPSSGTSKNKKGSPGIALPSKGEVKTLGPLDERAHRFLRKSFSSSLLSNSRKLDRLRAGEQLLSEAERRAKEAKLVLSIVGAGIQLDMLASGLYWTMAYGDGPKYFLAPREGWSFSISPAPMNGRMIDVVFPIETRHRADLTDALRQRSLGRYILGQERALEYNALEFGERKALARVIDAIRAGKETNATELERARYFMVHSNYINRPRCLMFARRPDR
jgi:hypothetical protein